MEEKTSFKLTRAISDTGTDTVSSKGGTVIYRITSIKKQLVNGKVVSTSTPSCTLGSAPVGWALWGGVTLGNGYLEVKFNYSENTGPSRATTLILDQEGSDNKIHLTVTQESTLVESWEIRFNPLTINGADTGAFFTTTTNISGEKGSMAESIRYRNLIVNQNRHIINIYISSTYPEGNFNLLSWSCLDKNGKAFSPNYDLPDNQYFTTHTSGLGSYTLKKISNPPFDNGTLVLPSSFNPLNQKYPLNLNFYWGTPQ